MLQVGQIAPSFEMDAVIGKGDFTKVALEQYKGKWVVLFFYPLDFTFVCPTEITAFNKQIEDFKKLDAVVIGCSTDSKFSHRAWVQSELGEMKYPLAADLSKEVARKYGVLLENAGIALRGVFIVGPEGKLRYQLVHDLGIGRNVNEIVRVLQAIQHVDKTGGKEVCPVNWQPGSETLQPK